MSIYYHVPTPLQYWQHREQRFAQLGTANQSLPTTLQSGVMGDDTGRDSSPMRYRLYASSFNTYDYTGWFECLVLLFKKSFSTGVFYRHELMGSFSTDPHFLNRVFSSFPIGRHAYRPVQHGSIYSFLGNALTAARGPLIVGARAPGYAGSLRRVFLLLVGMDSNPNADYVYYLINPRFCNVRIKCRQSQLERVFFPLNNEVFYSTQVHLHESSNELPQDAVPLNEVLRNR